MLDLTAAAEVDGIQVSTESICSCRCRTPDIDSTDDDLKALAGEAGRAYNLVAGSLVAPVWPPTGGGSAMGSEEERQALSYAGAQGVRASARSCATSASASYGSVRIDSAASSRGLGKRSSRQHQAHRGDVS